MKIALTANSLKFIALLLMVLDHFVAVFMLHDDLLSFTLRAFGRIAAPVFCYFIAEGFHHTSNKKKYIIRMILFAVVSHIPYNLLFNFSFWQATSIMWSLALGLIALTVVKSEKYSNIVKISILLVACFLSVRANWNFVAVLWIVAFGVFRDYPKYKWLSFIAIGVVLHIGQVYYFFGPYHNGYPHWYQLGIFLAIPLLGLYNGQVGAKNKWISRLFYVSYPGHMLIFYGLRLLFTL